MEQTLRQLGDLLLGAIPTVVLLLALYGLYHVLLHKPLEAVLAERRKRTQGAVEQARADIAMAASRTTEYENRLREARLAVFKALDSRRKQAVDARTAGQRRATLRRGGEEGGRHRFPGGFDRRLAVGATGLWRHRL